MPSKSVTTVLYETSTSKTICSIEISQKSSNDFSLTIISPDPTITLNLFKFTSQSTCIKIFLYNVENSRYSEYINSITMCLIKAKIPIDHLVSYSYNKNTVVYCPNKNYLAHLYLNDIKIIEELKNECINIYNKINENLLYSS